MYNANKFGVCESVAYQWYDTSDLGGRIEPPPTQINVDLKSGQNPFFPHIDDMHENQKGFTWIICWGNGKYIGDLDFYQNWNTFVNMLVTDPNTFKILSK